MAKNEPMLQKISQIYAKDIYAENGSNPTSRLTDQSGFKDYSPTNPNDELQDFKPWDSQMMWNYFLVRDFYSCIKRKKWVMPVIQGFID